MLRSLTHLLGAYWVQAPDSRSHAPLARLEFPTARCVVFGHSHIPWNEEHDGQLLFNPGSATDRRRQPRCSIGMLYVDDEEKRVWGEIIWL